MTCEQASLLMDDYFDGHISRYEYQRFEAHLASCSRCTSELQQRRAFEHSIGRAITASVQNRSLSPAAKARIRQTSEQSIHRAIGTKHTFLVLQVALGAIVAALVFYGILAWTGHVAVPTQVGAVSLSPAARWLLSELDPTTLSIVEEPVLQQEAYAGVSLSSGDLQIEPSHMQPGEPFVITLLLHSDLPQPAESALLNLDVAGPPGYYSFTLAVQGPLPANGVSVLHVTPDLLARTCEEQYLIKPEEIFGEPGVYTVRVTVHNTVPLPES